MRGVFVRFWDLWRNDRVLVASVVTLTASLAWSMRDALPYGEFSWRIYAGACSLALALLGWWAASEWSDPHHVWIISTLSDRRTAIVARTVFAVSASAVVFLSGFLALARWTSFSAWRTVLWAGTAGVAAAAYYMIGYCLRLGLPRTAIIALLVLWGRPFLRVPSIARGITIADFCLPPFTLFSPRELWSDFPLSSSYVRFLGLYSRGLLFFLMTVAEILTWRRSIPGR